MTESECCELILNALFYWEPVEFFQKRCDMIMLQFFHDELCVVVLDLLYAHDLFIGYSYIGRTINGLTSPVQYLLIYSSTHLTNSTGMSTHLSHSTGMSTHLSSNTGMSTHLSNSKGRYIYPPVKQHWYVKPPVKQHRYVNPPVKQHRYVYPPVKQHR